MRKLQGVPKNSFAYLDQMKRYLGNEARKATRAGDNVAAAEYKAAEKSLVKPMDKISDDYRLARQESQKSIVRSQLEKALKTKEINGRNFYNKVLQNDTKYEKLLEDLKNAPEATEHVKNMKLAWEHLIGKDTVRSAAGMSSKNTADPRGWMNNLMTEAKNMWGAPRDVERVKFMHDPNWWDKFDEVMKYKDRVRKNVALGDLIAEGLTATTLETAKQKSKGKE